MGFACLINIYTLQAFGVLGTLLPLVSITMVDTAVDFKKQNSTSQHGNNLFLSEGLGFGHSEKNALLDT